MMYIVTFQWPEQTKSWNDFIEQFFVLFFFKPPPQPSQYEWESLQSILWIYLSWLVGIFILEKLASGWSPSARPLLGSFHIIVWVGPVGVFKLLEVCLIGKWDKKRPLVLQSFGGLFLWRTFLAVFGGPFGLNEWWHVRSQPTSTGGSQAEKGIHSFGTTPYDFLQSPHSQL